MFQENRNSLFNPEIQQKFFKYFNDGPIRITEIQVQMLLNLLLKNRFLFDSRFYTRNPGNGELRVAFYELPGLEDKLKHILKINPKLFSDSDNHLVFFTVSFNYNQNNTISIHIDKQVMSTIYTNPPHGKVEYENTGLPNFVKQEAGGMSALSVNPTRFIIKNFDDLCTGFVLITDSFQDPKHAIALRT